MELTWPGFGSLWEGPHAGEREVWGRKGSVREFSPWEKEAAETMNWSQLQFPAPPCAAGEEEVEKKWEWSWTHEEGKSGGRFLLRFYFSLSYFHLIHDKFNSFPQVKSVLPRTAIAEWSIPPYSYPDPQVLLCFVSSAQLRMAHGILPGSTCPNTWAKLNV